MTPLWKRGARGDFKKERFSKRIQQNKADYDVALDIFLTMLIQYLKIGAMKKLLILMKRTFFIVGLIIATIFFSAPAGAGGDRATFTINGSDVSLSGGAGLRIPLSGLFSLDLNLSSVATGPSSTGERQLGTPPIPFSKPPQSDLHYTRLGVGFSFRF